MYQERMFNYYPLVIQIITEFQAIIDAEYPEFNMLASARDKVINDAYLPTMSVERIKQWEKILGIIPSKSESLDSRRATIMAKIRGQNKLNTATINSIVNAFTGGTAESWVSDNVLHINILIENDSLQYNISSIIREIDIKKPAHLGTLYNLAQEDCAENTTLYVGGVVTTGVFNEVTIIAEELDISDFNSLSAVVITYGQHYYMEVL